MLSGGVTQYAPPRGRGRKAPALLASPPDGTPRAQTRIVPRAGDESVVRVGFHTQWIRDIYHELLVMPGWAFLLVASAAYLLANVGFALLYLADPSGVAHARPGVFADAFFFSIQTMATIGYGVLYPVDLYANVIVTIETVVALLVLAVVTGLVFARFSRPTARVMFSRLATVAPHDGVPTLQIRLANGRRNQILEADVALALIRDERTSEGQFMRRFHSLRLARSHTPIFAMTFTLMHAIDADSPLHGLDEAALDAVRAELVVTVTGIDETMSQTIHARHSYTPDEIRLGAQFADMFGFTPQGRLAIDFRQFDRVIVIADAEPDEAQATVPGAYRIDIT